MSKILIVCLVAGFVCWQGCVSPEQRRRDYLEEHAGLEERIASTIREGKVAIGMSCDEVRASWGEPDQVVQSVGKESVDEIWTYDAYHEYQANTGPVIVNFLAGKVTSWTD